MKVSSELFFVQKQLRVMVGNRSIPLHVCENLVEATKVSNSTRKNETLAVYYFWNISYVQAQRYVCQSRQRQEI